MSGFGLTGVDLLYKALLTPLKTYTCIHMDMQKGIKKKPKTYIHMNKVWAGLK